MGKLKKLRILVTNDDGIRAPGLRHLVAGLQGVGEIIVLAPAGEQSGRGVALSMHKPLHLEEVDYEGAQEAYSLSGTPADCVKMALSAVLKTHPDIVVSGINRGSNAGRNVLYSGTVGATIEAAMRHLPAIAFSCQNFEEPNYAAAASYVKGLVEYISNHPLPSGTLLNVNFPNEVEGIRLAKQGQSYYRETPDKRLAPQGKEYWWLGGMHADFEEHEESDIHLLKQGFATAVPIYVGELTHHSEFTNRRDHFRDFFAASNSSK